MAEPARYTVYLPTPQEAVAQVHDGGEFIASVRAGTLQRARELAMMVVNHLNDDGLTRQEPGTFLHESVFGDRSADDVAVARLFTPAATLLRNSLHRLADAHKLDAESIADRCTVAFDALQVMEEAYRRK